MQYGIIYQRESAFSIRLCYAILHTFERTLLGHYKLGGLVVNCDIDRVIRGEQRDREERTEAATGTGQRTNEHK